MPPFFSIMTSCPQPIFGLLVSQIGYDTRSAQRAVLRVPAGWSGEAPVWHIASKNGDEVRQGVFSRWGDAWKAGWWVAIFELTAGAYELRVEGVPELSGVTEEFSVDDDLLYRSTWEYVGLEQMETRVHFALPALAGRIAERRCRRPTAMPPA